MKPEHNFDRNRCALRNRVAARRDGCEATPVRFMRLDEIAETTLAAMPKLPKTPADIMDRIRACQPEGADELQQGSVYALFMEAANDTFIPDRFMFLTPGTLQNVAKDGETGVAFMNSHRTGGMSHPTELPFGRTFAGQFMDTGTGDERNCRAMLGAYMLAGAYPNGTGGPSTDDLFSMIQAGTLFDVSVGLYGGQAICDICGLEPGDGWTDTECVHCPGTTWGMTPAEVKAQAKRGVTDGCASYSLDGARLGEVSAVYDGAVPGAGFRKAIALSRNGKLDELALTQAAHAYRRLARQNDFGGEPQGLPFEEQALSALGAVEACIDRAEAIAALREAKKGNLSSATRDRLNELSDRLARLHNATRPDGERLRILRMQQLRLQVVQKGFLPEHQDECSGVAGAV